MRLAPDTDMTQRTSQKGQTGQNTVHSFSILFSWPSVLCPEFLFSLSVFILKHAFDVNLHWGQPSPAKFFHMFGTLPHFKMSFRVSLNLCPFLNLLPVLNNEVS